MVMEHAHGFGVQTLNEPPLAWASFPLSPPELLAWSLLQELWPGSFHIQEAGDKAESNYMVAAPFGDTWDVLAEVNFTQSLSMYRVAVLGGDVSLDPGHMAELMQWVEQGGVLMAFASQFRAVEGHDYLIGVKLGANDSLVSVGGGFVDHETKWHSTTPSVADHRPFCSPQTAATTPAESSMMASSYYIKTGGDPSKRTGWDGGEDDKCCASSPQNCRWFATLAACNAALAAGVSCAPCGSCRSNRTSVSCPDWEACPVLTDVPLGQLAGPLGNNASVWLSVDAHGTQLAQPAVLRNNLGAGAALTILMEDPEVLRDYGVVAHLLSRLSDEVLPIETKGFGPNAEVDMKTRLQVLFGRAQAGWHVTMCNNHGVAAPLKVFLCNKH